MDELSSDFYDMILNNYWSGLVDIKSSSTSSTYYIYLPRWYGDSAAKRARTIFSEHFKDGDVLIYYVNYDDTPSADIHTKEDGLYVYIGNVKLTFYKIDFDGAYQDFQSAG